MATAHTPPRPRGGRGPEAHPAARPPLALAALILIGCARPEGDALVVATPWPARERAAIASDYRKARPEAGPIAWVAMMPGDEAARLAPSVDLLLGAPALDLD